MIKKAFTLAEVFIAMVILAVLVSVCVTFFTSKKDYEREYMYYSAYLNLTKVVDSALLNEKYLKDAATPYVEETTCGTIAAPYKCRAFKNTSGTLCKVLSEYFNTTGTVNCTTNANYANKSIAPSFKLTNGMEFFFETLAMQNLVLFSDATLRSPEINSYTVRIDINSRGTGEDKSYYDYMTFYITRSGKVIPAYGTVGIRGYEYSPAAMDAGGNASLIAFDVVQVANDSNQINVVNNLRSVSFVEAACKSGYISQNTNYCKNATYLKADGTTGVGFVKDVNCTASEPCEIRLVKKLRRVK